MNSIWIHFVWSFGEELSKRDKWNNQRRYIYNETIKKRHNIIQLDCPINSLKWAYKQPKARLVLPCPSSPLSPDSCYRLSDWQQLVNRAMTTFITETAMHNPDLEAGWEPDKVMPHRSVWFYRHLFILWQHWAAEVSWIGTETIKMVALLFMVLHASIHFPFNRLYQWSQCLIKLDYTRLVKKINVEVLCAKVWLLSKTNA